MLQASLTEPRKPPLFEADTDLVEYSLDLLGLVESMNEDRATVREAVTLHNQRLTQQSLKK